MSDAKSPSDLSIDEILATIRRIISEDEQAGGTAEAGAAPAAAGGDTSTAATGASAAIPLGGGAAPGQSGELDDVLELTEALNDDGTTRHLAPIGGSVRRAAPAGVRPVAAPPPEPQPERREAAAPRPAPPPAAATPPLPRDLPVGGGTRTLEDVVGEVLRPLLQRWLDENLPPMVDRLVQAEIARRVPREAGSA